MKLRIATWNLERPQSTKPEKMAALSERMQAIDSDIWILTEAHQTASPALGYTSVCTSTIKDPLTHSEGECRTAIWTRLPINQIVETHDPETAVCIEIETTFGPMLVYGTVIPYHAAGTKYSYRSGEEDVTGKKAWQLHYESIARHSADWKRIRSEHPNHHFCCGGDFNQNRDGRRWYGTKQGRQLLGDALQENGLACATEEDFRGTGKLTSRANIAHICLNQERTRKLTEVGAWEAGLLPNAKRLSDHNGVWVDIERL